MLVCITWLTSPFFLTVTIMAVLLLALSGARVADSTTNAPFAQQAGVPFTISLELVTGGLTAPVDLQSARDGSGRLFVVELAGRIRVIENGTLLPDAYLDISSLILDNHSERGLLGLAFDADFESNGEFYVNYTSQPNGDTVVARYVVSDTAANVANVLTTTHLITIGQPQRNHNGGQLQFGPNDNYLYVSTGDGGGAGDDEPGHAPQGNAQSLGTHLGKILRIDVRAVPLYTVPASNPFTQTMGALPEIWAYGLRNPWRFSFDQVNGDVYIADVGQNSYEEVSYRPASSGAGVNYGWRCKEGFQDFNMLGNCPSLTLEPPVVEYDHTLGCSVTGGYVYRGSDYPWMDGVYFYADYCSGRIWALQQVSAGTWSATEKLNTPFFISSFGEGEDGELYVIDHGGEVYKLTSNAAPDLSDSVKLVSNSMPLSGSVLTYNIVLRNAGSFFSETVSLTDVIPTGLIYVAGSLSASQGIPDASSAPTLTWSGGMSNTFVVTVSYAVMVTTVSTETITNIVSINPGFDMPFTRTMSIMVNGLQSYWPLVFKGFVEP